MKTILLKDLQKTKCVFVYSAHKNIGSQLKLVNLGVEEEASLSDLTDVKCLMIKHIPIMSLYSLI